ncbi:hypothetical protein LAC81_34675 (plasmid) [Ensifer adhaerens]|uniref:hypothetical protein n=1 Tax=Ensifer adhaerens TaxID=106592 RepID=UPI001CC0B14F|nr:hypothetical protein [Ensifer adhaerens]MBZ7927104.1 hypothetical protein [Ensifer adhaerens]UAX98146.1 hypothetical protein LAC78_35975 [Ensifer adhaerens]UAY05528.1 hypothetical protein LAC80_34680 [Ensifer adhaerens]UAY12906.1 hypothetical protein LAC81_34675 [Ensifer adhaerens]
MKSPWKFLADLASRGRTANNPASAPEAEPSKQDEPSLAPQEDTTASFEPSDDVTSAAVDAPDEQVDLAETVVDPTEISEPASAAIPPEPPRDDDHGLERAPSTQPKTVQRRARKISARPVAAVEAIEPKEVPVVVRPPPTMSEQVAFLDEEVRQLRRQLSEKLRLQNEQLERLLKRFDPS